MLLASLVFILVSPRCLFRGHTFLFIDRIDGGFCFIMDVRLWGNGSILVIFTTESYYLLTRSLDSKVDDTLRAP
jgi:hypothetical protein